MAEISFAELVQMLPRGDEFASKKLPAGLSYFSAPNPWFVEPRLHVQRPVQAGKTSVVLVSAPGAVGKSTLAAALAARTGAVVWDLSQMNVGTKTFAGTVLQAFDAYAHGVLKRIVDGRWLFVLDALDEAQVRAGSQNFEAFLSDLAELCRDPRPLPTIVLLARSDTADLVALVLEEGGVNLARYKVEYFDGAQAVSFIEKRLDKHADDTGRQRLHRQQAKAFAEARDALFRLVFRLFDAPADGAWSDPQVRDFLGYAPVLEALARYLDVTNYQLLLQEVKRESGTAKDPWQFLNDIIGLLQVREQLKFQNAVRPALESTGTATEWPGWSQLYRACEQCGHVLRHSLSLQAVPPSDLGLSEAMSTKYLAALRLSLPEHPFLDGHKFANVVFKEFTYAWGITSGDEQTASVLRRAMRDRETPFLPSPLFSRFVAKGAANGRTTIDGQDFGIVYESLLARSDQVEVSLFETVTSIEACVRLGNSAPRELEFELLDTGLGVHFWRKLVNAEVDIARRLRIGLPEQRFALGPAVDVTCGEFDVQCDDIDVDVLGNVRIHADTYTPAGNLRVRIRNTTTGRLAVTWPNVGHPWAAYRRPPDVAPQLLAETVRGDVLRKFILMFRRQRSRRRDTVMNARWAPDQLTHRDQLIELTLREGVLTDLKNGFLGFNSDFDSLKTLTDEKPNLARGAREFVAAYLGEEITARLLAPR